MVLHSYETLISYSEEMCRLNNDFGKEEMITAVSGSYRNFFAAVRIK